MIQDQKTALASPEQKSLINPQQLADELDPTYFERNGMMAYDSQAPVILELRNLKPLEENGETGLFAVIDAGGTAVQLYGKVNAEGKYSGGYVGLARADKDLYTNRDAMGNAVDNDDAAVRQTPVFLWPNGTREIFGREPQTAATLGLTGEKVSRKQVGITRHENGTVRIQDLGSTNRTRVITRAPEKSSTAKGLGAKAKRWLGGHASKAT